VRPPPSTQTASTRRTAAAPRVLVVDDEEGIRRLLLEILEDEGYEARGARDGLAALELLDSWTPDLILLDLSMPRMDGWEFLEARRQKGLAPDVPVIVLSASRHIDHRLQAEHTVLPKPFEVERFLTTVQQCMSGCS
jgi:CheY-like chemotaxis protein